jgi:hypothetical protein
MEKEPCDEPSEVSTEDGSVKMHGPDSVDVSMTPEAALQTSDRLFGEAMKARGAKNLRNTDAEASAKSPEAKSRL